MKRRVGPLIANPDGTYTAIFDDGSYAIMNGMAEVIKQDDSPNPVRLAMINSGNSDAAAKSVEAASVEDARRWNLTNQNAVRTNQLKSRELSLKADEINRNYKIAKMNARTEQEAQQADAWYQQEQAKLARDTLNFDREKFSEDQRQFNVNFGEGVRQFDINTGLKQADLGARMVENAASLTGADKVFEAYDLNRGYGSMQQTPGFLSALQSNTRLRDFGAQGGAPQALTQESLIAKLQPGYANSAESRTTQNALGTIHDIGVAGAHKIGAGQWESLNDDERASFLSGLGKAGFQRNVFLSDWQKSRIGQGTSGNAFRAA